jgi:hypothetical protein
MGKALSYTDDLGIEMVYGALIAFPNLDQAKAYIEAQGYQMSLEHLKTHVRGGNHPQGVERYEQVRRELAPRLEASLAGDLLDNARLATQVENVAIERTLKLLNEGRVRDPSRVARDLSQVATQSVDKRLALQGRPTQIVENRNVDEMIRSLEGLGVAKQVTIETTAMEIIDADQPPKSLE